MAGQMRPLRRSGQRGVALVEFAIALPLLAILVFGTLDLGRAYAIWNETKNAAREGAAYARSFPCDTTGTTAAAEAESDRTITVTVDRLGQACPVGTRPEDLQPGERVIVRVESELSLITPIVSGLASDVEVGAEVEVVVQ